MLFCVLTSRVGSAWPEDLTAARACVGIADTAARLACYDAAFAATPAPAANPVASAPPMAQFGDNGQLALQHKAKAKLPKKLELKAQSVVPVGQGLYRLTLENGQIWQTRQADWALEFKSGDKIVISRMALDSYQISLAGQGRSVSVRRIQ
jgi:hypothetical protein